MSISQYSIIVYIFFMASRIRGCFRRWQPPLLRGPEWFFNVRVQPGFYEGSGKKILHHYWIRIFIPFALDVPLAIIAAVSGQYQWLGWLVLASCVLVHLNHSYSVDRAERQAWRYALPEEEQPVATVVFSLTPRRLRDYSSRRFEWGLAVCSLFSIVLLVRYYAMAPERHSLQMVFWLPAYFLYVQLGFLLAKLVIVAWGGPVPQAQATEHMKVREETRKYYLKVCDWSRASAAAALLMWPILLSAAPENLNRVYGIWFAALMVVNVIAAVWVEIKRKQLVNIGLNAYPVKLPDFLHQSDIARWPVCYQPAAPMLVLRGARGYSLNMGNKLAHFAAAYLAGIIALLVLLQVGH
ncbi:MAG TPA: hypothetical protein VGK22_19740 [Candidatus Angelobacter sp.]|jgi:hypothetical protein